MCDFNNDEELLNTLSIMLKNKIEENTQETQLNCPLLF